MIKRKLTSIPYQFTKALPIMDKLQSAGFEVYFVGGSLRDLLLNDKINDIDLATNALPNEVKEVFPHNFDTGIKHGTVTVVDHRESYEITTYRSDGDYLDHRHPQKVEFVNNLKEDLKRRDFTINALAMTSDGEIVDYYGGLEDLNQRIIRCVLNPFDRFEEDALRIFRAIRFISQLGFTLDPDTFDALKDKAPLLENISIERIHSEFVKTMKGKSWQKGLSLIYETKVTKHMPYFMEEKLLSLLKIEYQNIKFSREETIWAVLFYLEILPSEDIKGVLATWKTSNSITKNVQQILNFCSNYQKGLRDYRLFYGILRSNVETGIFVLEKIALQTLSTFILEQYDSLPIHKIGDLAVTGNEIIREAGFKPGVSLGKMLKLIEKKVLKGELVNDHDTIINFVINNNV